MHLKGFHPALAAAALLATVALAEDEAAVSSETAEAPAAAAEASLNAAADAEAPAATAETPPEVTSRVFRLAHVEAEYVAEKINTAWACVSSAEWKVMKLAQPFPDSNTVLVTAPAKIIDACERLIAGIDVETPQVYIEARFVELSNNASHKLGIDWQMLDGMKVSTSLDAGLNKRKMDGVTTYDSATGTYTIDTESKSGHSTANLSYINGTIGMSELYVILRALESSEDARTFSNPKIIVSSGKKATVDMTTKYPNVKISAKRTTNSGGDSLDLDMQMAAIPGEDKLMFAKEAFFSWGIALEVVPRVEEDGLIHVAIVPTISSQSSWVESGTSSENADEATISARYPVIDVQRLVTEFDMASGTTAVIGGLSLTVESQKDSGIPLLRDIWWIGPRLFGSKVRVKEQKEIIVFVTVGIVDPHDIRKDAGLPKNAVLGRQYSEGVRREPGDRRRQRVEGINSLDLRPLEEQYADPRRTNGVSRAGWSFGGMPLPFFRESADDADDDLTTAPTRKANNQ